MNKKIFIIYLILVVITTLSYALTFVDNFTVEILALVCLITFIKGQLIIDYFMNLKNVSLKYRLLPTIWLIIVLSVIFILWE